MFEETKEKKMQIGMFLNYTKSVTLMVDFNCSEVNWKTNESGYENRWGNRLLILKMNNTMIQWITNKT